MKRLLMSWLDNATLSMQLDDVKQLFSPILPVIKDQALSEVHFISQYLEETTHNKFAELSSYFQCQVKFHFSYLPNFAQLEDVSVKFERHIQEVIADYGEDVEFVFLLDSSIPEMASIWSIMSDIYTKSTRFITVTPDRGVQELKIPFKINTVEYMELTKPSHQVTFSGKTSGMKSSMGAKKRQSVIQEYQENTLIGSLIGMASGKLLKLDQSFQSIVHKCPQMKEQIRKAKKYARTKAPIIILGESGTGKELFANAIHSASSRRCMRFESINCGAIPSGTIDSELFGHEKGGYTGAGQMRKGIFEVADQGTVFLDEIGELPRSTQAMLLRVLANGEFRRVGGEKVLKTNVRIISATNRDLNKDVEEKRFREDLFYRIAEFVIEIPAIRNRPGDIEIIVDFILEHAQEKLYEDEDGAEKNAGNIEATCFAKPLTDDALEFVRNYPWPGNFRQLESVLHRAIITSNGDQITREDIEFEIYPPLQLDRSLDALPVLNDEASFDDLNEIIKSIVFEFALQKTDGNYTQAAKILGYRSHHPLTKWRHIQKVKSIPQHLQNGRPNR